MLIFKRNRVYTLYNVLLIFMLNLFVASLLLTQPKDRILLSDNRLYPLFYTISLPLTVWITIPLGVFLALFSPRPLHRILSVLILSFSIEFLPSFMLVNPWLPDQYPYLAEAYWIYLHGKIYDVHYLDEVPVLGLLYGMLQIITNIDSFKLSKLFSLIQATSIPIFLMIISRHLYERESLLPILFLAFNYFKQINVFHRASLHFTYALLFIFLIFKILNQKNEASWKLKLALSLVIFSVMVLAYPGSGYILASLAGTYALLRILDYRDIKPLTLLLVFSISIFVIWYLYVSWSQVKIAGSIANSLMEVLRLDITAIESARHPYASGLTHEFQVIVYSRLTIEGIVLLTGFIASLISCILTFLKRLRGVENNNAFTFVYLFTIASFASVVPWLLTEWSRWAFYKFNAYFLLVALLTHTSYFSRFRGTEKLTYMKLLAYIVVTIALISVPLLRYASLPYLYVTTTELHSVTFVHKYYEFASNAYYLEYAPQILSRLLVLGDIAHEILSFYWFKNPTEGLYILTMRALTREGFYTYPEPLHIRLKVLEEYMNIYGEKVYDNVFNRAYYLRR